MEKKQIFKAVVIAVGVFFSLIIGCKSCFTVDAGEVGVLFNKVSGNTASKAQGTWAKIPFVESVTYFDVKTQKLQIDSAGASKDLQEIKYETVINFHLDYETVNNLFVKVGEDYNEKIIIPCVNEAMKASTSEFPVENIIRERFKLKEIAEKQIKERLLTYNIIFESLNIVDIDFTPEFNKVVEEKQIEEQKIKTAEYLKLQAEENKKRTILDAQAEAEKQRLLRQTTSKEVIALKWIEKWNGDVPQIITGKDTMMMVPSTVSKGE